MFYGYVRYLQPGDAMKMLLLETLFLISAFTFMHMFVFEDLSRYLSLRAAYNHWFDLSRSISGFFEFISHSDGYGLGPSTKQACIVWLITTPFLLMFRGFQNMASSEHN